MTSCPTRISAPVSIVERSTRTAIRGCPSETALAEPVLGTAEEDSRTIRADFPRTPPIFPTCLKACSELRPALGGVLAEAVHLAGSAGPGRHRRGRISPTA